MPPVMPTSVRYRRTRAGKLWSLDVAPRFASERVRVPRWVVVYVRIAIQRLRIARLGHQGVRLREPPQRWVVPSGVIVVQPLGAGQAALVILAGEGLI